MQKAAAFSFALVLILSGCSESRTGDGGAGGTAGTGGMGGTPPPPPAVDQTCREWCANEPEGPSCHQGPFESVQPCYEDCLSDYQREAGRQCGDEWIAIKDCQIGLDCEDLFGDCNSVEDEFGECVRLAGNRIYCETNCPQLDITQCEQDITECRQFAVANDYCASKCPAQDREECIAQFVATEDCGTGGGVVLTCATLDSPPPDCDKACTSDSQCEASFCQNGKCVANCTSTQGCGAGSTCDTTRGRCVPDVGTGRIFRTDTAQNANLGGIAGADAICAAQALAAGLEGEFKAWLSTIASPVSDRLIQASGPYVLVDGTRVADDWDDLVDGSILAPINLDANGVSRSGDIWTGTLATGASYPSDDCGAFTNGSTGVALCGASNATNATWTENITPACSTPLGLYCIEQVPGE